MDDIEIVEIIETSSLYERFLILKPFLLETVIYSFGVFLFFLMVIPFIGLVLFVISLN